MLGGDELTELYGLQDPEALDCGALDDGEEEECDDVELGSFRDLPLWFEGPGSSFIEAP
jgi:hypothetical protein